MRTSSSGTGTSESVDDEDRAANPRHYENEYSFSDTSQGVGEESDSDEETGRWSRKFKGLSEDDRKITRALEKSLGMAADDPDIAEAARRLLDSKILSPEFFQGTLSEEDEDDYRLFSADTKSEDDEDESWTDDGDEAGEDRGETSPPSSGLILPVDMSVSRDEGEAQGANARSTTSWQSSSGVNGEIPEGTQDRDIESHIARPISPSETTEITPTVSDESPKQTDGTQTETPVLASSQGDENDKAMPVVSKAETDLSMVAEDDSTRGRPSREDSSGGFWSFDNNTATPMREGGEPLPLPPSNEGTPLLNRQGKEASAGPSTPLNPSIFTTVAALAEQSSCEEDERENSIHRVT